MSDYDKLTPDDIKDFQAAFGANRRYEEMAKVIEAHDPSGSLLHLGRMWGWSDTEVRDDVMSIVESIPTFDYDDWG